MNKNKLKIEQIGSTIGRKDYQALCLKGLGLGKLHSVREVEDTPSIRGLIRKVHHLVKVHEI